MIASIRDNSINLPLFLHVAGAMVLTGALFTVALVSMMSWRASDNSAGLVRLGFKTIIWGVLPAYMLMRIGAQWVESEEGLDEVSEDPTWLAIGYITADLGALLVLVSLVVSIVGLRKLRAGNSIKLNRTAGIIASLLCLAYLVAMWAMTTKVS